MRSEPAMHRPIPSRGAVADVLRVAPACLVLAWSATASAADRPAEPVEPAAPSQGAAAPKAAADDAKQKPDKPADDLPPGSEAREQGYEPDQNGFGDDTQDEESVDLDAEEGEGASEESAADGAPAERDAVDEGFEDASDADELMFDGVAPERGFPMSSPSVGAPPERSAPQLLLGARFGLIALDPAAFSATPGASGDASLGAALGAQLGLSLDAHRFALDYTRGLHSGFDSDSIDVSYAYVAGRRWRPWLGASVGYTWASGMPVSGGQDSNAAGLSFGASLGAAYHFYSGFTLGVSVTPQLWLNNSDTAACDSCSQSNTGYALQSGLELKYLF